MENTLKKMKTIDGAFGEGGGQVLRSSLTLSMITKTPIELINIRAKRSKPGLMRQHLTAIEAAKTICNAEVVGANLGAETIQFYPGEIQAGNYDFSIGTAGSTVLVCQTILLALAYAPDHSRVRFEGGTHNGLSPSLCFFEQSYLPVLRQMGLTCDLDVGMTPFVN
ncbi:RNA 3'-terminal phosphate cyclase [Pleionea litopenaei]|uniref:RNA 3'-terminal-phosphate cyclase (ATP) n=1 Tax=Pleionea litopenaei TaxID=3070815 RepID=A0AA51RWF7_9GAMM|nr:RNA 3'-terminal phosphate cyclase [Pleionea sp. HL-JVS1]WMS88908.1 RNA 3'-terminal phosphate cyclase [Pleionea sp. HL-JVS1]